MGIKPLHTMPGIPFQVEEVTTIGEYLSTANGSSSILGNADSPQTTSVVIFIIQSLIGFFTLFGNLLIIRVLYDLPNSKLKRTTKLLICYVSASHCIVFVMIGARFFNLPCWIVMVGAFTVLFNIISGMLLLAIETLILVKRPYSHHRFISVKICKIWIFTTFCITVCIDIVAYVTMKEPDDASACYFTNGNFNPIFLCLFSGIMGAILCSTTAVQISLLRAMKKVFPVIPTVTYTASSMQVVCNIGPQAAPGRTIRRSPLHKLTAVLSLSLLCSFICWCPMITFIFICSMLELLDIQTEKESEVFTVFRSLVVLNGILHVIVYLVGSTQIRQAIKKYLGSWATFMT